MKNIKLTTTLNDKPSHTSGCPLMLNRRSFLASTTGALTVAAMEMGLFDFTSSLLSAKGVGPAPIRKARIQVGFVRPDVDRTWLGWPGAAYDQKGMQKQYTKVIKDAAGKLGIDLMIDNKPIHDEKTRNTFLESVRRKKPDGILITNMNLNMGWKLVNPMAQPQNRENIPMVIFSPVGSSFTGHLQETRNIPGVFVGSTPDIGWLATALRMLNTIHQMKNTRLCIVKGDKTKDKKLNVIGTTLHYIPEDRFPAEFKKVEMSDEIRAIAEFYTKNARKIVEPTKEDILTAAKNYIVCRRLMAAENCHGFSMNCLGPIEKHQIQPPCLAFSHLRNEGIVAACEADRYAAISSRLTHLLLNRPGFMQDPVINTVNNTLIGAHCACATKLDGFDNPHHEPFILRSHSESNIGVALQVLWRIGQEVTVMEFDGPEKIILGTGRVLRNLDTPPSGGCRTSVEIELDGVPNTLDTKGFHQLFIYGNHENAFKAYCQLAGIEVEHI